MAIEVPRGPIVDTLLEKDIAVFAVNPKQLDRFRDRHTVAGAKDDRRDALVLADSMRTDKHAFRSVRLGDPLLEKAPTPELAKRLSLAKLGSLLKRYRIRCVTPEQVRETLAAEALHVAPGVIEACRRHVTLLIPRLRLVHEQKLHVEREIDSLLETLSVPQQGKAEHRDARLLQSLPGLGKLVCATMLAEASEPLERRDYSRLRTLCGVASVTRRSGKQHAVSMRTSCSRRLRYAASRAAGHSHGRALRGIADRLLATVVAMLKANTFYEPARPGVPCPALPLPPAASA